MNIRSFLPFSVGMLIGYGMFRKKEHQIGYSTNNDVKEKIIEYILKNTSLRQFNTAIENYNLRSLYNRHKNYLLYNFFEGNTLRYSVEMAKIFDEFQTTEAEQMAKEISDKMADMRTEIKRRSKFKMDNKELVQKYNVLVDSLNALNEPVMNLSILFRKYHSK